MGSGAIVAILGFLDDHGHIAARWRLIFHFVAAIWAIIWMGGIPPVAWFHSTIDLGWFGQCLAVIYLVWMLNLYNFMDGIDGIASVEAISTCIGGFLLCLFTGTDQMELPLLLMAASVLGFFYWNFPPAKIFMGDAGSGFLGMVLGLFSLLASQSAPSLLWAWLIMLGVFIVDATLTLIRRFIQGKKVYEAHRSHAYQHASRVHLSHLKVTLSILAINILWLLPLAALVATNKLAGVVGLTLAYIPLVILAIIYKAGSSDEIKKDAPDASKI